MLLIVAHHYVVNSGLMNQMSLHPWSAASLFYLIFGAWGKTGINCFVLITGFYMCESKLTLRKYIKLLLEVYFYRIVLFLVFFFAGRKTLSLNAVISLILPFSSIGKGFTGCFLAFYLFIPFLNLFLRYCTKKQHLAIISLLIVVYTILPTIPTVSVTMNYVTWFIVCYIIGAFLRLYNVKAITDHVGIKLFLAILLSLLSITALAYLSFRTGRNIRTAYYLLSDSNKPFALLVSVFAFSFFHSHSIGYNPWINMVASTTFGVLLIHANSDAMRTWLWKEVLQNEKMYGKPGFILHAVISVLGVFILCSLIDLIRIRLLERPVMVWYDKHENSIIDSFRHISAKKLLKKTGG